MPKLALFLTLLPLLAHAAPQLSPPTTTPPPPTGTTTPTTAALAHIPVAVPTQGITLTPEDHAAITALVDQLDAHLGPLQRRGPLPSISGLIHYIPSVILPTIFNMAYDMLKDMTGKDDPDDIKPAAGNVTTRDDGDLASALDAELQRRGLGSLAAGLGTRLSGSALRPVLAWLPSLIPALIGPAFAVAQELFDHADATTTMTASSSRSSAAAVPTASAAPANGSVARRADDADAAAPLDYPALVGQIQAMLVETPGILLNVPGSPADVPVHTMMSPGLAVLSGSAGSAAGAVATGAA